MSDCETVLAELALAARLHGEKVAGLQTRLAKGLLASASVAKGAMYLHDFLACAIQ